jgi:hypothetical protein
MEDYEVDEELKAALEASTRDTSDSADAMDDRPSPTLPPAGANSRSEPSEDKTSQPSRSQANQRRRQDSGSSRSLQDLGGPTMEAFRNFAAEGMAVPHTASVPAAEESDGMEILFPPPAELMFHGNFDALRRTAEEQQNYCLVNIQKHDEFSSHCLNRDTWKVSFF